MTAKPGRHEPRVDVRTRAIASPRAIVYDCEIFRAIPDKKKPRVADLEYCEGWGDKLGMGISVIAAIDTGTGQIRVFLRDNLSEFAEWTRGCLLVGFANHEFDDELLRAHGLFTAAASYDILRKLRKAVGETEHYTPGLTARGRRLGDLARANLTKLEKIDDGANAPVLAQRGKIGALVDYCLCDVMIAYQLFRRREALVDPVFGVVVILEEPTLPAVEHATPSPSVLDIYLPKWTQSPLAGKRLREISTVELEAIGVQQRDRGGSRGLSLVSAIADELERRREEEAA